MLEVDVYRGIAVVGGGRRDVGHVFYAVDGLLQRNDDRFLHRFCVGSGVVGVYLDGGRCDVGVLFYGEVEDGDDSHQHNCCRKDG